MVSTFARTSLTFLALLISTSPRCSLADKDEKRNSPSLKSLRTILGKRSKSREVAAIHKHLKKDPEVTHSDGGFYYSWKDHGLEFLFEKDTVQAIFLYADGADEFKQYRGELPDGLHFSDARREVEKKLGKPKKEGGNGVIPFWVTYPEKGVGITYVSEDTKDMANKIHHITISAARGK